MSNEVLRKLKKFESKDRLEEMQFEESISLLEINGDSKALDLGSGTGVFTFSIAKYAKEVVSVEIQDSMIEIQNEKISSGNVNNVKIIKENLENLNLPFDDNYFDSVILSTIVHEIDDKEGLFSEIERVTKNGAKILILEFKKEKTPYGPPLDERISDNEMRELTNPYKFKERYFNDDLNSFYRFVYENNK